ncbi:cupin domain-containing protein [Candidatus Bathyarchaeota archaeon]|nr:cupin domain-containing protein [Candidatus Bathyarchaeota archaeon]
MKVKKILSPEISGSKRSSLDEVELEVDERLQFQEHPEERLYYFLSGRGIMSIYDPHPKGDVYEVRQDTAIWLTPKIKHHIFNIGHFPLRYIIMMVAGGVAPEGGLSWSTITERGVTVEKPLIGAGQATIRVFDEHSNPSFEEGLHLRIRPIPLRRPQKFAGAEVLTIYPGRATRPHTHYDTEENFYLIAGRGNFIWNEKRIPCNAGSGISYPAGVIRCVRIREIIP